MQVQRPTDEKGVLSEVSFTLVVNAHGALLGLTMDVEPKELLVVKNLVSGEEMHSLVIRVSEETASLKEVAIDGPTLLAYRLPACGLETAARMTP